ncbi:hypothetical protein SESBI_35774 [Sesbania bispinosa]|nr:hypothetical protein SESBI_35774 [Sesbania bispinosa]
MESLVKAVLSKEEEDLLQRSKKKSKVGGGPKEFFSRKVVSYRDVCIGVNGAEDGYASSESGFDFWEENMEDEGDDSEEMEVVEEDNITILCPSIKLSKSERIGACIPWKRALIIKLLGKRVSLKFLQGRLHKLWQPKERMEVIDIDNDFFVVRFTDRSDLSKVYEGGPWVIMGHYLGVQRWKPEFLPYEDEFKRVSVWIRVPGLPIEYYDDHILWRIGDVVGHTIKIDPNTLRQYEDDLGMSMVTERGKFARICVEVDLRKESGKIAEKEANPKIGELVELIPRVDSGAEKGGITRNHVRNNKERSNSLGVQRASPRGAKKALDTSSTPNLGLQQANNEPIMRRTDVEAREHQVNWGMWRWIVASPAL